MFLYVGLPLFIYIYHFITHKFSDNYLEDTRHPFNFNKIILICRIFCMKRKNLTIKCHA